MLVSLYSCDIKEIPGEEDYVNHPVLWSKSISAKYARTDFFEPIVDEYNNVYMLLEHPDYNPEDTAYTSLISYDKEGHFRWEKKYNRIVNNKVFCFNDKIVLLNNVYLDKNTDSYLIYLDAETSEVLNTYSFSNIVTNIAASDDRVYLISRESSESNNLHAFDLAGNEIWVKNSIEEDKIMVSGNTIYLAGNTLKQYIDTGGDCIFGWNWTPPEGDKVIIQEIYENDVYVYAGGDYYIILKNGAIKNAFPVSMAEKNLYFQKVTQEGDYIFANRNFLYKYSINGEEIWQTESNEGYVKPNFREYNISIAQNGNIYSGSRFGLYAYRSDGVLDWHIGLYQDILDLHRPIITSEGNLICLSPERGRVYCIKGDGSPSE